MRVLFVSLLFAGLAHAAWVKEMENENTAPLLEEGNEDEEEFVEGDIRITKAEYQAMLSGSQGRKRGSQAWGRWPNPTKIPYVIHSSLINNEEATGTIAAAIDDYQMLVCLQLVPRTNENNYIEFGNFARGCSSYVGYDSRRKVNSISLVDGCWGKGIIMHEIGHSLGLYHEQSRPDRDSYVQIMTSNIKSDQKHNFNIMNGINSLGTKYDYLSMMHYGRTGFSKNGQDTIRTKDSRYQKKIGQKNGLSMIDIQQIRLMYPALPATCRPHQGPGPRVGKHNYCGDALVKKWNFVCGKSKDETSTEDILTSADEAKRFLRHSRKRRGVDETLSEECCKEKCADHEVWETCPGN